MQAILLNAGNLIIVSSLSLWEISIKYTSGKLQLGNIQPEDFIKIIKEIGLNFTNLSVEEASTFYLLPGEHHKDPFDRILIWQAMKNNYVFISDDKEVKKYSINGLQVVC